MRRRRTRPGQVPGRAEDSAEVPATAGNNVVHDIVVNERMLHPTAGALVPTLFDHYTTFAPRPAAFFGLDVVRRPGPGFATVFGGGYIASGPTGADRAPLPLAGKYVGTEGAGEVQTPLRFHEDQTPRIGDRVWFRHAKAGELMEHFTHVHLVRPREATPTGTGENIATTYRGDGFPFG